MATSLAGTAVSTAVVTPTKTTTETTATVLPTPQQQSQGKGAVDLTSFAAESDAHVDTAALKALGTLDGAIQKDNAKARVIVGALSDPEVTKALTAMGAPGLATDKAEGCVLLTGTFEGRPTVVIGGKDAAGHFYGVQTLAQLTRWGQVPSSQITGYPLMSIRGAIEGFYGRPWSHKARLDQFKFYAKHKMNAYIYTTKYDPYLRAKWRELYPQKKLDQLKELVGAANANHVDFTFEIWPGNDICYSKQATTMPR